MIPGGVALLAGLVVLLTRFRAVGVFAGLLGAVAGAWFIVGAGFMHTVLNRPSIVPGVPVPQSGYGIASTQWSYLELMGFFTGVGILIILVGAIVMGRFSMLSVSDAVDAEDVDFDSYPSTDPSEATDGRAGEPFLAQPPAVPRRGDDADPGRGAAVQHRPVPGHLGQPVPAAEPPGTFPRSTTR